VAGAAVIVISDETLVPFGFNSVQVTTIDVSAVAAPPVVTRNGVVIVVPTVVGASIVAVGEAVPFVPAIEATAAFTGTTDKSPNPSEATATADTFFNEIVFTIFLSFSQIKDDLLSGW
jgi:hypothetical protein